VEDIPPIEPFYKSLYYDISDYVVNSQVFDKISKYFSEAENEQGTNAVVILHDRILVLS
jgi:hypothetical protein